MHNTITIQVYFESYLLISRADLFFAGRTYSEMKVIRDEAAARLVKQWFHERNEADGLYWLKIFYFHEHHSFHEHDDYLEQVLEHIRSPMGPVLVHLPKRKREPWFPVPKAPKPGTKSDQEPAVTNSNIAEGKLMWHEKPAAKVPLVLITSEGVEIEVTTDADGAWKVSDVPPGGYEIQYRLGPHDVDLDPAIVKVEEPESCT